MRDAHVLEPTNNKSFPKRMIFFDSESQVQIKITEDEIQRARANKTAKKKQPVKKWHHLYLICANFYRERKGKPPQQEIKDYCALNYDIKIPESMEAINALFLRHFWSDVDKFTSTSEVLYMFAHNAKYDVQVMQAVPELVRLGYRVTSFSDSNPLFITFEKITPYVNREGIDSESKRQIVILSSTNYYAQPLKKLGEIFKLPKLDFDHDQEIKPYDKDFMKEARIYGHRDVEILTAAMLSFISFVRREGLGKFRHTVAGQTFSAYRNRFMMCDLYIHDNVQAMKVERRAYSGGRNECFRLGKIDRLVYYLDINSMYPYVMRNRKYPTKLITFWNIADVEKVDHIIKQGKLVCADCLVNTDIPIFHAKKGKLVFQTGRFWTTLSTPEIIEGIKRGFIESFNNVSVYESDDIFSRFVDYFYTARLKAKHEGDKIHDTLFKIFLNALYGKFGQKNPGWEMATDELGNPYEVDPDIVDVDTMFDPELKKIINVKVFGGHVFIQNPNPDDEEAPNSFPAIAAHVTAYARMLLWSFIEGAGMEHVYYCDTDSVFVDSDGFQTLWLQNMIDPDTLGALKIESIVQDLELYGCKDYQYYSVTEEKQITKMKGISAKAVPLGENEFGQLEFAVTQWGGFTDRFKGGNFKDYYNKVIVKTLKRQYDKGEILDDGRIKAFYVDDVEEERKVKLMDTDLKEKDPIQYLVNQIGHIRVPLKGERYYPEYKGINRKVKGLHFRYDRGLSIADWCKTANISIPHLFQLLNK
ncbi:DNA polymerase II [compost metagenome]